MRLSLYNVRAHSSAPNTLAKSRTSPKDRGLPLAGRTLGAVLDCATAATAASPSAGGGGGRDRLAECGQRLAGELEASANLQLAFLVRLHVADLLTGESEEADEIVLAGISQKIEVSSLVTKVRARYLCTTICGVLLVN